MKRKCLLCRLFLLKSGITFNWNWHNTVVLICGIHTSVVNTYFMATAFYHSVNGGLTFRFHRQPLLQFHFCCHKSVYWLLETNIQDAQRMQTQHTYERYLCFRILVELSQYINITFYKWKGAWEHYLRN